VIEHLPAAGAILVIFGSVLGSVAETRRGCLAAAAASGMGTALLLASTIASLL